MLRKYEWNMQDIWNTTKRPNLQIKSIEEGEEVQTKGIDNLLNRIIAENFPNRKKERGAGSLLNTKPSGSKKKHSQTHHNQNIHHTEQRKNSESCKKKGRQVTYKSKPIRITAAFSTQILNAIRSWKDIMQVLKENNCQPTSN
jgi:hypothetical protein